MILVVTTSMVPSAIIKTGQFLDPSSSAIMRDNWHCTRASCHYQGVVIWSDGTGHSEHRLKSIKIISIISIISMLAMSNDFFDEIVAMIVNKLKNKF